MKKDIVVLQQVSDGKLYTSYHIVDKALADSIREQVFKGSIDAVPTRAEAEALVK